MFQAQTQPYPQHMQPKAPGGQAPPAAPGGAPKPAQMNYGQWRRQQGGRRPPMYGGWSPRPAQAQPPAPTAPKTQQQGGQLDGTFAAFGAPTAAAPPQPGQYGGINPSAPNGAAPTAAAAPQGQTAAAAPQGQAPAAPWYQQADIDNFQNWAANRYGRRANQQELAQIGANSTNMESAQAYADTLARQQGWQGLAPATPAPESTQPAPFFQAPNQGNVPQLSTELMERILQNPESMSPEVVAQMKARSKQQASSMAEQLRGDARSTLAGRGFSGGGGMQAAADAAVDSSFLDNLLNANRDTDIQAATTNFNDRLNAAGAADAWQSGNTNRAVQEGGARLQEYLGRSGVDLDNRRFDETRRQFNQTFGFDLIRFLEDTRRNNRDFGENQRQHNNQVGLGYGNLNMQGQQQLLNWLMASTGGR